MKTLKKYLLDQAKFLGEAEEFTPRCDVQAQRPLRSSMVFAVRGFFYSSLSTLEAGVKDNFIEKRLNTLLLLKIYAETGPSSTSFFVSKLALPQVCC